MSAESETYVLFELSKVLYAIPSTSVQHIEMLEHVTLVPNAHRAIDGVVFSRGQVIPALNLRVRFGFPRTDPDMRTRVVFAQTQQRIVGLVVDSAREFRKIPATAVRPIEQALTGVAGNYLKGLTTIDNRLILILDLDAVLNLEKDESLANSLSEIIADATEPTAASAPTS